MWLPRRGIIGALGLLAAEVLLATGHPVVSQWFTPVAWTFYIFLVDALIERIAGSSPMTRVPGHLAWSALASVGIWYLFEAYNLRMDGWVYIGLPERFPVRLAGYVWAFATIGPGMFVTRELVAVLMDRGAPRRSSTRRVPTPVLVVSGLLGLACLLSPFLVSRESARFMWAPVWAGFIFLVDPLNAALGRGSIWRDAFSRDGRRLVSLLVAGLVCGGLWEFWNYWASAKWVYTFPFAGITHLKLFEMPIVGFIGFPPFAVEYYAMTELLARLWGGNADFDAPGTHTER